MAIKKMNTVVWVLLVILILLSYFFSENHIKNAALLIGVFSLVKFYAVGFQFMEAKEANVLWKIVLILFSFIYFTSIFWFY